VKPLEHQTAVLKAVGRIEGLSAEIELLKNRLAPVDLWRPAAGLVRQCDEALAMIRRISIRLERSLVVTVIGPSGSGKSTLVNALAGGDEVSPAGRRRPTTGRLIVLGAGGEDAAELARDLGEDSVEIQAAPARSFPAGLCLIDTPDTDSTAFPRHRAALERVIAQSDVLVCVLDAENPKRRDHADFLAPFVRRFDGESLVAVLNKCDRLDADELRTRILPDFLEYIRSAWTGAVDRVLCLSARRHIREPGWDPSALPRHDFDQFEALRDRVFGPVGRGRFVTDRRVENARQLHAVVLGEAGRELAADRETLRTARQALGRIQTDAMTAAAAAVRDQESLSTGRLGATVYQRLCMRWIGPVGWMLAVWTRMVAIGSSIAAMLRLGRSSETFFSSRRSGQGGRSASAGAIAAALRRYRLAMVAGWPEVAEQLVRGRFDATVRSLDTAAASAARFEEQLASLWDQAIDQEVDIVTRRLGGAWLQALVNAPALGILGYIGWVTVQTFFSADYLSGDYFLHAFWVIAIALLLSFFALQAIVRMTASPERIMKRAFDRLQNEVADLNGLAGHPLQTQLEAVLQLAAAASGGQASA
jgi:energy-coupling factor transporter ATP-binding protein EcfA2